MSDRGTLVVDSGSWHRRVYGYWERKVAHNPPETLNLCLYMRAVMIYVPGYFLIFALALTFGTLALIVTSPLWVPFFVAYLAFDGAKRRIDRALNRLGSIVGYCVAAAVIGLLLAVLISAGLEAWWKPLVLIAGVVGAFAAIGVLSVLLEKRKKRRSGASGETHGSGVASLSWSWLRAKKHRICPLIETRKDV